jgi:hypothetical protein
MTSLLEALWLPVSRLNDDNTRRRPAEISQLRLPVEWIHRLLYVDLALRVKSLSGLAAVSLFDETGEIRVSLPKPWLCRRPFSARNPSSFSILGKASNRAKQTSRLYCRSTPTIVAFRRCSDAHSMALEEEASLVLRLAFRSPRPTVAAVSGSFTGLQQNVQHLHNPMA